MVTEQTLIEAIAQAIDLIQKGAPMSALVILAETRGRWLEDDARRAGEQREGH